MGVFSVSVDGMYVCRAWLRPFVGAVRRTLPSFLLPYIRPSTLFSISRCLLPGLLLCPLPSKWKLRHRVRRHLPRLFRARLVADVERRLQRRRSYCPPFSSGRVATTHPFFSRCLVLAHEVPLSFFFPLILRYPEAVSVESALPCARTQRQSTDLSRCATNQRQARLL